MKKFDGKQIQKAWALGERREAELDRRQVRAQWLSDALLRGSFLTAVLGGAIGLCAAFTIVTTGQGPFAIGFSFLSLGLLLMAFGMDWGCNHWGALEHRFKKVKKGPLPDATLRRVEAAAAKSSRAREWKEDAAWSGRELRMFDVEAMEALAQIEGSALAEREGDAHWAKGMKQRAIRSNGVSNERMTGGQNGD